ncbi:DUF484 family protein [Celerinatantimonas diazotrophica]|uniref:DUF484 family protein n=1 Tax=Celerinatantimonas diazotrophica TaxID=412034 RepID=A0A4R1KGR0_9GAMM|nr:DUF484 family protein [Celerinatantimonas diazotrophica]TCK63330.1 hypothetical protein EV690_0216 [Celerinatantimonas diazotrophica]CAG9298474.1 hypothetical protein CEDIAZO_03679 [Celerinatantimonas diazotrophica]
MSQVNLEQLLLDDELVAEYLQQNPDFFTRFPYLADRLRIPHHQRGSVSLVELSLERMRDKIAVLETEISDLLGVASQNERIFRVYVDLLPQLLHCPDFASLQDKLQSAMVEQLGLSQLSLRLNQAHLSLGEPLESFSLSAEHMENLWVTRLSHEGHYFGRLTRGELQLLFASPEQVQSVAIMPLGERARLGVLAAASDEADHYVAGMDGLLLGQLCEVIATLLPTLVGCDAQ